MKADEKRSNGSRVSTSLATLREAATLSPFSRYTWRWWAQTGRVASERVLGRTMVPVSEIARVVVEARARDSARAENNSQQ